MFSSLQNFSFQSLQEEAKLKLDKAKLDAQKLLNDPNKASESMKKHLQKAAETIKTSAESGLETIKTEYVTTFENQFLTVAEMIPKNRWLVMEFPHPEKIERLAGRLNKGGGQNMKYLILNMSEHAYDTSLFTGDVLDIRFRGLPSPPLELFFKLVLQCRDWLDQGEDHGIVVHCYSGFTRSAVFTACYLFWAAYCQTTGRALEYVCKKLKGVLKETDILPTQKRYIDYFENILMDSTYRGNNSSGNSVGKYLTRVLITGIPDFSKFSITGNSNNNVTLIQNLNHGNNKPITGTAVAAAVAKKSDNITDQQNPNEATTSATTDLLGSTVTGTTSNDSKSNVGPESGDHTDENESSKDGTASKSQDVDLLGGGSESQSTTAGTENPTGPEQGNTTNNNNDIWSSTFGGNMNMNMNNFNNLNFSSLQSGFKDLQKIAKDKTKELKAAAKEKTDEIRSEIETLDLLNLDNYKLGTGGQQQGNSNSNYNSTDLLGNSSGNSSETGLTQNNNFVAEQTPCFVPYLEVWHREKMVYSSTSFNNTPTQEYYQSDSCVPFSLKKEKSQLKKEAEALKVQDKDNNSDSKPINPNPYLCPPLNGDVLIRVRHFDKSSRLKSSAFRLGFHTDYVGSFEHFSCGQLDTTFLTPDPNNPDADTSIFPKDGFVDLFFEDQEEEGSKDNLNDQNDTNSNSQFQSEDSNNLITNQAVMNKARDIFEKTRREEAERLRKIEKEMNQQNLQKSSNTDLLSMGMNSGNTGNSTSDLLNLGQGTSSSATTTVAGTNTNYSSTNNNNDLLDLNKPTVNSTSKDTLTENLSFAFDKFQTAIAPAANSFGENLKSGSAMFNDLLTATGVNSNSGSPVDQTASGSGNNNSTNTVSNDDIKNSSIDPAQTQTATTTQSMSVPSTSNINNLNVNDSEDNSNTTNQKSLNPNDVYNLNNAVWSIGVTTESEQSRLKSMLEESEASQLSKSSDELNTKNVKVIDMTTPTVSSNDCTPAATGREGGPEGHTNQTAAFTAPAPVAASAPAPPTDDTDDLLGDLLGAAPSPLNPTATADSASGGDTILKNESAAVASSSGNSSGDTGETADLLESFMESSSKNIDVKEGDTAGNTSTLTGDNNESSDNKPKERDAADDELDSFFDNL